MQLLLKPTQTVNVRIFTEAVVQLILKPAQIPVLMLLYSIRAGRGAEASSPISWAGVFIYGVDGVDTVDVWWPVAAEQQTRRSFSDSDVSSPSLSPSSSRNHM